MIDLVLAISLISSISIVQVHFVLCPKDPKASMPYLVGCRALAELIARYVPDKKAKLLDIAAGTGFLGTQVKYPFFLRVLLSFEFRM